jgi:FlaA1/EpsC-like NDP-sugar epimerase
LNIKELGKANLHNPCLRQTGILINEIYTMQILVTGAAGFIASRVCEMLLEKGERVNNSGTTGNF